MKPILLFLLLLCTANYAQSETTGTGNNPEKLKQYDIEIIIFEDAHARYIDSESWSKDSITASISSSSKTKTSTNKTKKKPETPTSFTAIEADFLRNEYKRIKNSSEYNVLFYSAWRQSGLDKQQAFEIELNELVNAHHRKSKNTITGTLKIVLARYLHFYSQLEYQQHNSQDNVSDKTTNQSTTDITAELVTQDSTMDKNKNTGFAQNNLYKMNSHRRMRSKELHYIDHPLLGILIQINPVTTDETLTTLTSGSSKTNLFSQTDKN